MTPYDPKKIEEKWNKKWLEEKVFKAADDSAKPKYYQLETFPYPSAAGLHMGHPKGYTAEDIRLLASVDAAHEDLSGPGVRRILQREFTVFGKPEFENLAGISASHIYNLRDSKAYASVRVHMTHTQARQVSIGERRKPDPRGQPGYLRVDTVHQGHHDGQPGVYHINAVDTVTQWQVVGAVTAITQAHLEPVLKAIFQ